MKHAAAGFSAIILLFSIVGLSTADAQTLRAGQIHVEVANPSDIERPDEVVELDWHVLAQHLPAIAPERVRVLEAGTGDELPSQPIDSDADGSTDRLLFLADFFPHQERAFVVEAVAPQGDVADRVHVSHMAERDDVAWENDRVAFRTYGEGLWALEDLVSSGIDVWMKRTRELVIDRWYAGGHYHTDAGEGADFFAVGPTLGAGGTAVWSRGERASENAEGDNPNLDESPGEDAEGDDPNRGGSRDRDVQGARLHRAPNFASHRIIANGPIRAVVELSYGPFVAGGMDVEEVKRITIDAGDHFFRSESTFRTPTGEAIQVATGLVEREGMVASVAAEARPWTWLAGWGPVARANGGHGDLGTAVLVAADRLIEDVRAAGHHLLIADGANGQPVVHYVAAGWTPSGDFDGPSSWWAYLDEVATRLSHPLTISFRSDPIRQTMEEALGRAHEKLRPFLDDPADPDAIPYSVNEDGTLKGVSPRSWTSGFYPGILWYLYDVTGEPAVSEAAARWTALLEEVKDYDGTHDLGFMIYNSFGNGYRLTGKPAYRDVVIDAANTLMTRYNPRVRSIRSWDFGDWQFPVIVDNMMNLELLFAATRFTGDSSYSDVAVEHARTTLRNHYRDDHSSVHVVDYDTLTGEVIDRQTHQGLSDESAWSRGQAWGLYGFVMIYRETGDDAFRDHAQRIADFILTHSNMPEDGVPYWDFDAEAGPDTPRDASAAAITASALYELSRYVTGEDRGRYVDAADRMLVSLASGSYQAPANTPGPFLLSRATGSVPGGFEIDVPIIYADYYYLEALLRRLRLGGI